MKKAREPICDLDEEEQELSDSVDRKEWKTVENLEEKILRARKS